MKVKLTAPYNAPARFSTDDTDTSTNSEAEFLRRENPKVRGLGYASKMIPRAKKTRTMR